MGQKEWRYFPEQCDHCGADSEIFTDKDLPEGVGYDSDELRCTDCGAAGQWNVYDHDDAWAEWF